MILSGKEIQQNQIKTLSKKVSRLEHKPVLVIIQIGENKASEVFVKQKIKFGKLIGLPVEFYQLESDVSFEFLKKLIGDFNHDDDIGGIIIQLPLPKKLQKFQFEIIELISPKKDVDGLTSANLKRLMSNERGIVPATARGIETLLNYYKIKISGKHIVIVGRSVLVGRTLAQLLVNKDATITICHSKTQNLSSITKTADIIISATGIPKLITSKHVSKDQVIIDVGISKVSNQICGDVDFKTVSKIVRDISPVPGGVGPMTVLSLFQNLLDSYSGA